MELLAVGKADQSTRVHSPIAQAYSSRPPMTAVQPQPNVDTVRIPTRLGIGIMSFVACCATFMSRTNISINLLAMVQPPAHANGSAVVMPDYGPRYAWSAAEQSAMLGAFHYGSFISVLPLGVLVDRYGHVRELIAGTFLLYALMQFVCPLVAGHSVGALIALSVLMGVTQSTVFSSVHKLITKWSPPNEIGKFTMYALGTSVGTIVGWTISGVTIELYGWQYSYYLSGALMLVFTLTWWRLVYDSPAQHPRIARSEREYIERSLIGVSKKNSWPPMAKLLTSAPIWAIVLLQFGNLWGFFFIVTGAPKFINEVLGFPIASTGLLASLPYLMRTVTGVAFAVLADWLRTRNYFSVMCLRRVFCVFSHIIPGVLLFALPIVAANKPYLCIGLLSAAFGFNGSVTQSVFANVHDVTPNFASTVLSLGNAVGVASGFLSPILITHLTAERNTIEEWRLVFAVNAVMFVLPALLFMVMGSGEVQSWNGGVHKVGGGDGDGDDDAERAAVKLMALDGEEIETTVKSTTGKKC